MLFRVCVHRNVSQFILIWLVIDSHVDYTETCTLLGPSCRVGGCPVGSRPHHPFMKGCHDTMIILIIIIWYQRMMAVSLVSGAAEECVLCHISRAGFEKSAAGIPGAVRTTRNSLGRRTTGRDVITHSARRLNLASDTAGELPIMPPFLTNLVIGVGFLPNGSGVVKWTRKWCSATTTCFR